MTTKIVPVAPTPRPVPVVPAVVSTPVFTTFSRSDVRPSFMTKAELSARVAAGVVFDVSGVPSTRTSQVVAVTNAFGAVVANVEVVEGVVTQVL